MCFLTNLHSGDTEGQWLEILEKHFCHERTRAIRRLFHPRCGTQWLHDLRLNASYLVEWICLTQGHSRSHLFGACFLGRSLWNLFTNSNASCPWMGSSQMQCSGMHWPIKTVSSALSPSICEVDPRFKKPGSGLIYADLFRSISSPLQKKLSLYPSSKLH